jgi:hypothetical protein
LISAIENGRDRSVWSCKWWATLASDPTVSETLRSRSIFF